MGKKPKVQNGNVATDTAKTPDPTQVTPINTLVAEPVVSKKALNHTKGSVRRSGRLQSVIKPVQNQVVEQIDLLESEKEDEQPLDQNENHKEDEEETHVENENHVELLSLVSKPCNDDSGNGPTLNEKINDDRVDHLVKTFEDFKSKGAQGDVSSETISVGLIYKSLYLDSQKKIEALTLENHELARKLELVLAKLEVYENINKSTQAAIVSNLEKAIETLVRPASYFGGHGSSNGCDVVAGGGGGGGGGAVAKESSVKKRRYNH